MPPSPLLSRGFQLPGNVGTLTPAGDTSADVILAIGENTPFPPREIEMGRISLDAKRGRDVAFGSGAGKVSFGASFSGTTGIAVLNSVGSVASAISGGGEEPLAPDNPLMTALAVGEPDQRYVVFHAGYAASAEVKGAHPVGAFMNVNFGVDAGRGRMHSVIHRISRATGARTAIQKTFDSFKLPRTVRVAGDLKPGTMLVTEVDGAVALNVAAALGYDFNYVGELKSLGLTGDVGLKLDLGLKATIGFSAAGRYLVSIDRPDNSTRLHVRLAKMRRKGLSFGLDLSANVVTKADLPDTSDEFVQAVFGMQGDQIVRELRRIEQWSDPNKSLSSLVAGLTNEEGLALIKKVTGVDPATAFEEGKTRLLGALDALEALPDRAGRAAWTLLSRVASSDPVRAKAITALGTLAHGSEEERRTALSELLRARGFDGTPLGEFLNGVATRGVLALLEDVELPEIAGRVLGLIDGGEVGSAVERLQQYIEKAFNLERIRKGVSETGFDRLNGWFVNRLSLLLEENIDFSKVDKVRATINSVITMREKVYAQMDSALNRNYEMSLAATWQKTTQKDALLDAVFDTSFPGARTRLKEVLAKADYDTVLTKPTAGVTLRQGVLSHSIERRSSVAVTLPYFSSKTQRFNKSVARVEARDDGGRILAYSLEGRDEIWRIGKFRSSVAVDAAIAIKADGIRNHANGDTGSWNYNFRYVQKDMRSREVEELLRPFVDGYYPDQFPEGATTSLAQWVQDLDREIEAKLERTTGDFGDVLFSNGVSLPYGVIGAWLKPRTQAEAVGAAKLVSLRLQAALRELLPLYYFRKPSRYRQNRAASSLLVWASIPPSTATKIVAGEPREDNRSKAVYWKWTDVDFRARMVEARDTERRLATTCARIRAKLEAAGRKRQAGFFQPGEIQGHVNAAKIRERSKHFHALLASEVAMTEAVKKALMELSRFRSRRNTAPSQAIESLAQFGARITRTFNSNLRSLYGAKFLRPMGSMLFLEAARALDEDLAHVSPDCMMALRVLKDEVGYDPEEFLAGTAPDAGQIALDQRLVSSG